MKASLKLEYSLRVLAQLARRNKGNAVTRIEELARLEDIPPNYLVQLLNELREGGLVDSKRGKTGGYRLARPADLITFGEVVRLTDGPLALLPCASRNFYKRCDDCACPPSAPVRQIQGSS